MRNNKITLFAVFYFMLLIFSCGRKMVAHYKNPSSSSMISEGIILKKNNTFDYYKRWDLGNIESYGKWTKVGDEIILSPTHSIDYCHTVEKDSTTLQDSLRYTFMIDKTPYNGISYHFWKDGTSFNKETNLEGQIFIKRMNIDSIIIYGSPLILPDPVKIYPISNKYGYSFSMKGDCIGVLPLPIKVRSQVKGDTLLLNKKVNDLTYLNSVFIKE